MADTNDYWEECLDSSFSEHGIAATPEQLKAIAEDVQVSHENYGMAILKLKYIREIDSQPVIQKIDPYPQMIATSVSMLEHTSIKFAFND